jgi:alanine dehydrogenase
MLKGGQDLKTLIINQKEVPQLLSMQECISVMEEALKALSLGEAFVPLRTSMSLPKGNLLALMPSYMMSIQAAGVKAISVFPGNHDTQFDAHQGVVLLYEMQHGSLQAVIDATSVTAIRTAAVSAVATRLLARPDAGDLALLGAGTQASAHLEAMLLVRQINRVRVWSRTLSHAQAFAGRESKRLGINIEVVDNASAAVSCADLICTVTSAKEPVLKGDWIENGAHVNAVGSSVPHARELDTWAVKKSRLFVDRRESTVNEAGDFLYPLHEGAVDESHIQAEIGEILLGRKEGRASADEITLFKSLGLAVEDLAAANFIYQKARQNGVGFQVEMGGEHFVGDY